MGVAHNRFVWDARAAMVLSAHRLHMSVRPGPQLTPSRAIHAG
jgi:hypothetical protein